MKPYLIIVEEPASGALRNVAVIRAENEQQAESGARCLFPGLPEQDLCLYDIHELNRDYPDGWVFAE